MVRIGIDALGIDEEGGARTSILQMIHYVTNACKNWKFYIYLSEYEPSLATSNIKQIVLPIRRGIFSRIFMQAFLPIHTFLYQINLIHFTKSQASLIPFKKKILTIHDLTIIIHPELHSRSSVLFWKYIQPFIAKRMNALIAVSNDAAHDIEKFYHIPKNKITVIYNTSQFNELQIYERSLEKSVKEHYQIPKIYFLYVGLLALKKNLDTLIKAYDQLKFYLPSPPKLILIGPRYAASDASNVLDLIGDLGLEKNIRYLGKIPKDDLYIIYKNASIFLFPSIHEGFGIPCLEAMQLGVPLIASKASAIPEIVGNAGILINDFMSPESWAKEIADLYKNPRKKEQLITAGFEQFHEISNQHSFSAIVGIYQNLLNGNI